MSLCCDDLFYQKPNDRFYFTNKNDENSISKRRIKKFSSANIKLIEFNINIIKLTKIMNSILTDFCEATVIGYEKIKNKYWCKNYHNKECSLHIELEIIYESIEYSTVKFVPVIGTENIIENFVSNFVESIELYRTSPFIRACLEKNWGL